MNIEYDSNNSELWVKLSSEIDHHATQTLRNRIDFEIQKENPRKLIFDFSGLSFMDSAGIGLIMGRYKNMKLIDGDTYIVNANDRLKKVLTISGIESVIPIN